MDSIEKCCCFTGYRPQKFGFPLIETDENYRTMYCRLVAAINDRILDGGCTVFYTGMAAGFDIIAGEYVELITRRNKNIRLIAAVPYKGQESGWNDEWQQRYRELLSRCCEVIYVSEKYDRNVFSKRNRFMVDRSQSIITYYDGKPGGTGNTLRYAKEKGLYTVNIYDTDTYNSKTDNYKPYLKIERPFEYTDEI